MYLIAHNAHLTAIQTPQVFADPGRGISGSAAANRWSGDMQAYIDEDTTDEVRGGQRITVYDVIVDLPANIPVVPNNEDLLQLTRIDGGASETLIVRMIDRGLIFSGKLRVRCRRS